MGDTQDWYDSITPSLVRAKLLDVLGADVDNEELPSVGVDAEDFEELLDKAGSDVDDTTFALKDGTQKTAREVLTELWNHNTIEDQELGHERDAVIEFVRGLGID